MKKMQYGYYHSIIGGRWVSEKVTKYQLLDSHSGPLGPTITNLGESKKLFSIKHDLMKAQCTNIVIGVL